MAKGPTPFEVPAEMRAFAEQSVEQAKEAFDKFMSSAQEAMSTFEGQAAAAQAGAKSVNAKAMNYAERNVRTAFEFAQRLVQARDPQDLARLQAEFVQAQMQALTEQARELGEAATKAMGGQK
jgi:phasin